MWGNVKNGVEKDQGNIRGRTAGGNKCTVRRKRKC